MLQDESLMKFSNRPEDNEEIDLNAAEIVEGYEPFIRKVNLSICLAALCPPKVTITVI